MMSCGNALFSKPFSKQLVKGGTEMPIESVLGLSNEKLFIIAGLMSYQQYVQTVDLSLSAKAPLLCVFLKPCPIEKHSFAEIIH